jgi:hypothetical protein
MNTKNGNNLLKLFLALGAAGTAGGSFIALRWAGGHNCVGFINNCPAPEQSSKSPSTKETSLPNTAPIFSSSPTKETSSTKSFCPSGTKTLITAETNSFLVFICGENSQSKYVGIAKSGGASIHLPLSNIQFDSFTTRNGSVSYILTPHTLTVKEDGKTLREDPITSYQSHSG